LFSWAQFLEEENLKQAPDELFIHEVGAINTYITHSGRMRVLKDAGGWLGEYDAVFLQYLQG